MPFDRTQLITNLNTIMCTKCTTSQESAEQIVDAIIASEKTIETIQNPALINSWSNLGGEYEIAGFYKDSAGLVYLFGAVKDGIASSIFILPQGYRPAKKEVFATIKTGSAIARVDVLSDGQVVCTGEIPAWVSISGISFRAA